MKCASACLLLFSAGFAVGWIFGAHITAHKIAEAIRAGRLSVVQRIDHIAEQMESGQYKSVE